MFTEESLKILVPLFTAMLGIAIGYFLKKSEYERQRRDDLADREDQSRNELADRERQRRLEFRDKKIAEAKECIDTFMKAVSLLVNTQIGLMSSKNPVKFAANLEQVRISMDVAPSTLSSMISLNNSELAKLGQELSSLIYKEQQTTIDLMRAIHTEETLDNKAVEERIKEFARKAGGLSGRIQAILDNLSQTIP